MAFRALPSQAAGSLGRLVLLALASLAIAGCQLVPRSAEHMPPAPQAAEVEEEEQAGPMLPAGETRNRVAVLVPLTGSNAAVGRSIANAANLALADLGSERIRITAYDTAPGAEAAVNRALADGSGLFLGPLLAEDARAIAPLARAANVPVIAFSNDVSIAGDGVYVMGLNPGQSIERVVEHARSRGALRFGALLPTSIYGERAGRAFTDAVQHAGGQVSGVQTYDRTADRMRAAATALAGQGPFDAVLIADGARMAVRAAPMLKAVGAVAPRILGTELWSGESTVLATPALRGAWYAAISDARYGKFVSSYRSRFGAAPYRISTLGYDSVLLTLNVARDWRPGSLFPTRKLGDRGGFIGLDGAFRFAGDNVAERSWEVREVGTGIASPAPTRFPN